ncbi:MULTISPECIES: DotD/TraH family lipoprotein [unclassified Burkholderia]|uniref:DotD/TraH family lipoprotein n=1 Tax=unclassified Burkholderia TaxID=2613784 RepID=UPI002AB09012|nr:MULTISPECIES: DotD/TraH family lipoprotein [unclassified Burkholderia]
MDIGPYFQKWRMAPVARRAITASALVGSLLVVCGLEGCANPPVPKQPGDPVVDAALEGAYKNVAGFPGYSAGPEEKIPPPELSGDTITVVWQGDADALLRKVAVARGMEFKVYGPYPRLALPVFINMTSVPFAEFMTDVGHQFGQRADLVLTDNQIQIVYRGPAQ